MKFKGSFATLLSAVLVFALCFALAACGGETACEEHTDTDSNGKCDICGADVEASTPPCTEHTDANYDGKCDNCGTEVEPAADGTLVLVKDSVPTFQIVIGDVASSHRSSILAFVAKVNERVGDTKVSVADENSGEAQPVEILIGSVSNRGEQYAIDKYSLGYDGYIVEVIGTKLVVLGGSDSALSEAISDLEKEIFGIKGSKVKPIENLTVTESIDERVKEFTVESVTIADNDMKDYVIAANSDDTYAYNVALAAQETIYRGTGKHLEIVELSTLDANTRAIIFETVENGGDRTTEEGLQIYVSESGNLVFETEFPDKLATYANEFIMNNIAFASKKNVKIAADLSEKKAVRTISYTEFGAKGDGHTDDSEAIRAAHEYANKWGHNVVASAGATYYIGAITKAIPIRTNTDWNGAKLIFDDSNIMWNDSTLRQVWIFDIVSDDTAHGRTVQVPEGLSVTKGQTNIGMTFDEPCMIKIVNNNNRIFIRYGENENLGSYQCEMILVDKDGNVDPSTPIQYDYDTVTQIVKYSTDDTPISVGNAKIERRVPNPREQDPTYDNNYCFFYRGLSIRRSNTTLYNIEYSVENEDLSLAIDRNGDGSVDIYTYDKSYGVPYHGAFYFHECANVSFESSTLEGHQAHSFWQGDNKDVRNEMGNYAIYADYCVNISFDSLTQYENKANTETITNRQMYHGIMGSNFCRNFVLDNCYMDRFDSHQGLHNATLTNSTFGFGILVIGGGTLHIENVTRLSGSEFIHLRADYNSLFDGDVIIKNCVAEESIKYIINGMYRGFHYAGLPNVMTRSINIDGLIVKSGELTIYSINGAAVSDSRNPLVLPTGVTVKNIYKADGKSKMFVKLSVSADLFSKVPLEQILED